MLRSLSQAWPGCVLTLMAKWISRDKAPQEPTYRTISASSSSRVHIAPPSTLNSHDSSNRRQILLARTQSDAELPELS